MIMECSLVSALVLPVVAPVVVCSLMLLGTCMHFSSYEHLPSSVLSYLHSLQKEGFFMWLLTRSGKSHCWRQPRVADDTNTVLVVCPLVALMLHQQYDCKFELIANIYVPRNLQIYAISKLRCAN